MIRTARIQKRLILLIAFSFAWIFIGSLVIFHQEHVMGKINKWHSISFVLPKSKEKHLRDLSDDCSDSTYHLTGGFISSQSLDSQVATNSLALTVPQDQAAGNPAVILSFALRGPPEA